MEILTFQNIEEILKHTDYTDIQKGAALQRICFYNPELELTILESLKKNNDWSGIIPYFHMEEKEKNEVFTKKSTDQNLYMSNQEFEFYEILNNKNLTDIEKGACLQKIVFFNPEAENIILDTLRNNGLWQGIIPYFFIENNKTNHQKTKDSLLLTMELMEFYGISIKELNDWTKMINKTQISEKALKFLQEISYLTPDSVSTGSLKIIGKWHRFMKKCLFAYKNGNSSIKFAEVFQNFLEEVLDNEYFGSTLSQSFYLNINNHKNVQILADVSVIYYPLEIPGVILFSNGDDSNETQIISYAIAVCQQNEWSNTKYIYFFRTSGFYVTCYRGQFDKQLCKLIAEGKSSLNINEVLRFPGQENRLNLLYHEDRCKLAEILCSIQEYIKKNSIV